MTDERLLELWKGWLDNQGAPRRFALYEVVRNAAGAITNLVVLAYGLVIDEETTFAVGVEDDGQHLNGHFESAQSALEVLGFGVDARLHWLDAEVA
ncbi:hypothetical protein ACOBQX_16385 [Actinokineospora sp. G85]|uniref:hypothetical protein n=1 Tax=Actinokineospora sp. G85 TaxID=3406626 RepID=UPI003C769DDC